MRRPGRRRRSSAACVCCSRRRHNSRHRVPSPPTDADRIAFVCLLWVRSIDRSTRPAPACTDSRRRRVCRGDGGGVGRSDRSCRRPNDHPLRPWIDRSPNQFSRTRRGERARGLFIYLPPHQSISLIDVLTRPIPTAHRPAHRVGHIEAAAAPVVAVADPSTHPIHIINRRATHTPTTA